MNQVRYLTGSMELKKGQIVQIEGYWGFLNNPQLEIMEINGGLVTTRMYPNKEGGILSHMNTDVCGIDILISKIKPAPEA